MKHKNGQIKNLGQDKWYISFGNGFYLKKNGEAFGWKAGTHHASNTYNLIMHKTREQAQATLDKYNKSEPTLAEIKEKLSAAKKLIGKKIKVLKGDRKGSVGNILSVRLVLDESSVEHTPMLGPLSSAFFKDNGYVIHLSMEDFHCLYDKGVFEIIPSISVKNHSGQEYFAEQHDKYWQFGCAKISKSLIVDSLTLMQTTYSDNNRAIVKITIGAADFDFETLKKLVDADNSKG